MSEIGWVFPKLESKNSFFKWSVGVFMEYLSDLGKVSVLRVDIIKFK